jgi:hypothetical protein
VVTALAENEGYTALFAEMIMNNGDRDGFVQPFEFNRKVASRGPRACKTYVKPISSCLR